MRYLYLVGSLTILALVAITISQGQTIRAKNQLLSQTQQNLDKAKEDFHRLKEILEFERASIDKARQEADSIRARNGWITMEAVDELLQAQENFDALTRELINRDMP